MRLSIGPAACKASLCRSQTHSWRAIALTSLCIMSPWASWSFLMVVPGAILNSRSGRAMMAIRDNPVAAATMGINLPMVKTTTFGLSAMFAGHWRRVLLLLRMRVRIPGHVQLLHRRLLTGGLRRLAVSSPIPGAICWADSSIVFRPRIRRRSL